MSADDDQALGSFGEGRSEAHTAGDFRGGVGDLAADLAARLRSERDAADGEQLGLLDEGPAPEVLPIGGTRIRMDAARGRGGRPKGAANKRTELMRDYLLRRGYTHPMEALAAIASASVDEVAVEIAGGEDRYERLDQAGRIEVRTRALDQVRRAATDLLPYFESKRPVQVQVNEERLHVFLAGKLDTTQVGDGGFLSLTGEANPLILQGAPVGSAVPPSHDDGQAVDIAAQSTD